jgi:uncharacterized protein (DUF924 family)
LFIVAPDFQQVLDFWFGRPDSPERGRPRKLWFQKSEDFDLACRRRFLPLWERAAAGALGAWVQSPLACLALVVLLDQFPRNMFRGAARAFSTDAIALRTAREAIEGGFDLVLRPLERVFLYLPLEHAEDVAVQRRSLALFQALAPALPGSDYLDYARRHHEIIARFGRFPHRNPILGRSSSVEEQAFLAQPGSGF